MGLLLKPDLEALVDDVERHPAEEEVGRAEGRQVHPDELGVPHAELGELPRLVGRVRVGGEGREVRQGRPGLGSLRCGEALRMNEERYGFSMCWQS